MSVFPSLPPGGRPAGSVGSLGLAAVALVLYASPVAAGPADPGAQGLAAPGVEREPLRATLRQGASATSRESAEPQGSARQGPTDVRTRRLSEAERLRLREQLRATPETMGPRRGPAAGSPGVSGPTDRSTP